MPSGRTHDRITLWSLPWVTGTTLALSRNSNITLLLSTGFLFSGLMFGPDLDIYSRQFIRWGILRPFWIPYQKAFRHRSFFSHGLIIGTVIRCIYLFVPLIFILFILVNMGGWLGIIKINWPKITMEIGRSLSKYPGEWLSLFIGLELGSFSHNISDWGVSTYKRYKTRGLQSILPKFGKKKRPRKTKKVNRSS
ncbi:MAG TPA: metal-binding protein [Allocoleopsis sp.]